jgi:hypothetical protein
VPTPLLDGRKSVASTAHADVRNHRCGRNLQVGKQLAHRIIALSDALGRLCAGGQKHAVSGTFSRWSKNRYVDRTHHICATIAPRKRTATQKVPRASLTFAQL